MNRHRVFEQSPDMLELNERARHLLEILKVNTVYELVTKTLEQLSAVKYLGGPKTRGEIESGIARFGLRLGMSAEDISGFSPDAKQEAEITEAIRVVASFIARPV